MKRAKQLGTVTFNQNTLFIQEEFANDNVRGAMRMSAAGTHIIWGATIYTPYITLDSHEMGWLSEADKDAIIQMWRDFSTTQTLTYDDDSTDTVRMAVEKDLVFTPLYEGACIYKAIIPTAKT